MPLFMSPGIPVLFPSAAMAVVFSIAYYGWVLCEVAGSFIVPRLRRRRCGVNLQRKDRGSGWVVIAGLIASLLVAFAFSDSGIAPLPDWTFYPGIALMAAGIALRQWAAAVLGGCFSVLVSVRKNQPVIAGGPYRYVRHPAYAGTLLIMAGIGLAVRSWGACLLLLLVFCLVHGYRIRVEEQALVAEIGDPYRSYRERTKMLIPFVL